MLLLLLLLLYLCDGAWKFEMYPFDLERTKWTLSEGTHAGCSDLTENSGDYHIYNLDLIFSHFSQKSWDHFQGFPYLGFWEFLHVNNCLLYIFVVICYTIKLFWASFLGLLDLCKAKKDHFGNYITWACNQIWEGFVVSILGRYAWKF